MNGEPSAIAKIVASQRPPSPVNPKFPVGQYSPNKKLSRIAMRLGSAPTATQLPNRFVDGATGHVIRIEIAIAGIHSTADDETRREASTGRTTAASLGPSSRTPNEGLNDAPPCTS